MHRPQTLPILHGQGGSEGIDRVLAIESSHADTTPAVRAEIAASSETVSVLAQRFGITEQTVYKWKKREVFGDPKVGRFISMDEYPGAKRTPLTLNKHLYGGSDPVNTIDPSGFMTLAMMGPNINLNINLSAITGYGTLLTRMGARLLLIYGVGALSGSSSMIVNEKSKRQARDQLKDIVTSKIRGRRKNNSDTLYHYTDHAAAMEIFATQEMKCSPKYKGRLSNMQFPAGAYATDIEPWNPTVKRRDLGDMFYGGAQNRDLSSFVALNGEEFYEIKGADHQFVRQCSAGLQIPVEIYYFGYNLLD